MQRGTYLCLFLFLSAWNFSSQCPDASWAASTTNTNKCYLVVPTKANWSDAEQFCRSVVSDGHLLSSSSAFENRNILAVVENTAWVHHMDQFWIGASDQTQQGQFQWTDQTPLIYTNWNAGEPDSQFRCVSFQIWSSGRWWTQPCANVSYFVCESFQNGPATTSSSSDSSTTSFSVAGTTTSLTTPSATSMSTSTSAMSPTVTASSKATIATLSSQIGTSETVATTLSSSQTTNMTDCYDWLHIGGNSISGVYRINPGSTEPFDVYCDMDTDGGGWTVIQRRRNNATVFWNQPWLQYKNGFNNGIDKNVWLGLDRVHILSNKDASVQLRIELDKSRCPADVCGNNFDINGHWFGVWSFSIGDEASKYLLKLSIAQNGTLSSSDSYDEFFSNNNGQPFTTIDKDNDNWNGGNCASNDNYKYGGWWHNSCGKVCLNGVYDPPAWATSGISYYRSHFSSDYWIVPVQSEMKLRKTMSNPI